MTKAYYFDGDSVDLTDDQRELVDDYWRSGLTAQVFIDMCDKVLASAGDRKNKESIEQALAACYGSDADPGSGDDHLRSGALLSEIQDELDALDHATSEDGFDEHWAKLGDLVGSHR